MGKNTGAHGPPDDLEPVGRFEWEQSLRMLGIPWETKAFGLLLATYAASDGDRIHPGEERLARDTGMSERTVRRQLTALRETYYLIERTARGADAGRRGGWADMYRLVMPDDITDRAELLIEPSTKPRRSPNGQQDKLPMPVDNQQKTGHPRPVDNPKDRTPMSGDNEERPDTHVQKTGHPATEDRTPMSRRPDTHVRSPLQGTNTRPEQTPEQPGHQLPQLQGSTSPVDNPPSASDWNATLGAVRDRIAAAAAQARHARPTPNPITRPNRE